MSIINVVASMADVDIMNHTVMKFVKHNIHRYHTAVFDWKEGRYEMIKEAYMEKRHIWWRLA